MTYEELREEFDQYNQRIKDMEAQWEPWFAWYPVRLLTMEYAWLRSVRRRKPALGGDFSYGSYDYAWP